jgi:hypothetical protein
MEKIKVKIPEKCKDCVYVNKKGNCWALKDKCNPNSMNCDYRKDEEASYKRKHGLYTML